MAAWGEGTLGVGKITAKRFLITRPTTADSRNRRACHAKGLISLVGVLEVQTLELKLGLQVVLHILYGFQEYIEDPKKRDV